MLALDLDGPLLPERGIGLILTLSPSTRVPVGP